jgi:hypothetical protein
MPGTGTSAVEVTSVSKYGLRILLGGEELALPYREFPCFEQATIEQVSKIEWPTPDHLYWPLLDIDLSVESIRNPAAFPLGAKQGPDPRKPSATSPRSRAVNSDKK